MKKAFSALAFSFIGLLSFAQSINLYPDSLHQPFIYGVTSGDPTDSSVMIWTALADDSNNTPQTITWQLAGDSLFSSILKTDSMVTDRSHAYTIKADVSGLMPFTKYYYRFRSGNQYSVTGFTETAPVQTPDSLHFALVSCSSLFSGYFNAYRQIANNPAINAIIHVGDFIYDFIDPQERVRIPQPEPPNPVTLEDWNNRYRLYLLDPDLREARRRHPWIQIWDNHDLKKNSSLGICSKAFLDFTPVRKPSSDSTRIWRKLSYGPMIDIFMVDDYQYAGRDSFADGNKKMVPDDQFNWLLNGLDSSQAVWKILAVSKYFSPWELGTFAGLLPGGGLSNSWQGYPESRDSVLTHIARHPINNPVVVSGDLHMNIESDLALNPFDSTQYNRLTGSGGLGIEINGTSISRGNLDESGIPASGAHNIDSFSFSLNPQQRYLNLFDHGYALLTFNSDSLIARMMLCPILQLTDSQITDTVLFCRAGDNHWLRTLNPAGIREPVAQSSLSVSPNPAHSELYLRSYPEINSDIEIWNALGESVMKASHRKKLDISNLPEGIYFLILKDENNYRAVKFVKQ